MSPLPPKYSVRRTSSFSLRLFRLSEIQDVLSQFDGRDPDQRRAKMLGSYAWSTWQTGRPQIQEPLRIFASESLKYVRD